MDGCLGTSGALPPLSCVLLQHQTWSSYISLHSRKSELIVSDVLHIISHISRAFFNWELQNAYERMQSYFHTMPRHKYNPKEA